MTYDVIVLGSGPAGIYFAKTAAGHGKKVLIIEKDLVGGTGFRTGCLPAKKYLDGLRTSRAIEKSSKTNWCHAIVDREKQYKSINERIPSIEYFIHQQLDSLGVEMIIGTPVIKNSKEISIDGQLYSAKKIVIATGTQTNAILGATIDEDIILSHKGVLALESLPKSIVIVGGNVEGIEFASYLSGFGVAVTIIAMGEELLEGTDRDLCEESINYIKDNNGDILLNTRIKEINAKSSWGEVILSDDKKIAAEKILITGARSGNIPQHGDAVKLELENTCIKVDAVYESTQKNIYAIGDVNGIHGMAHIAIQQGVQLADYLYNDKSISREYESLPRAIFTIHEIAGAGLQENYCIEHGIAYTVKVSPLSDTFRAWSKEIDKGIIKVLFDSEEHVIGIWIAGENASDYVGLVGLWIDQKLTIDEIKASLFIHPNIAEGVLDAIIK